MLATRSIKTTSKNWAIDMAITMVDLTTLEGADTPGKVRALCAKAVRPDPSDPTVPSVGAICVYNDMVKIARTELDNNGGQNIPVAAVSTAFPSGRASMEVKIRDTKDALENGAAEIDMVIDRGAFLSGRLGEVFDEIKAIKEVCGNSAHLKVILETGELVTLDNVRKASYLAMLAGADFIKTSTGKVAPAATAPVVLVMLEAVRDYYNETGIRIGVKPAGGIRTTKDAMKQLVLVNETAGPEWLTPSLFRIGASALLNDLLMQRMKMRDGYYASPNYVTLD
jgi:deoxyribose-phosphate aldolase